MAEYLIKDTTLTGIADAIREKTGETGQIIVSDMATKIGEIDTDVSIDYENTRAATMSNYCFYNLNGLRSVSFTKLGKVAEYAFSNCSNLVSADFAKATAINAYAFDNCRSLVSINCPLGTTVSSYAFRNCSNLVNINIPLFTNIAGSCFDGCSSIESIDFSALSNVAYASFRNCFSLHSVNIPSVQYIEQLAFYNCSNLSYIKFSGQGGHIDNEVFRGCTNLEAVVITTDILPPTLYNVDAFYETPIANGTGYIYVADTLVDSYKTAENWSVYASQIKPLSEYASE